MALFVNTMLKYQLLRLQGSFFNETPHTIYEKDHVDILSGEETAINMLYHKIVIAPWNK